MVEIKERRTKIAAGSGGLVIILIILFFLSDQPGIIYGVKFYFPVYATCDVLNCFIEGNISHNFTKSICFSKDRLSGEFPEIARQINFRYLGNVSLETYVYGVIERNYTCQYSATWDANNTWCWYLDINGSNITVFSVSNWTHGNAQTKTVYWDEYGIIGTKQLTVKDWKSVPQEICLKPNVNYTVRIDFEKPPWSMGKFNISVRLPNNMSATRFGLDPWWSDDYSKRVEIRLENLDNVDHSEELIEIDYGDLFTSSLYSKIEFRMVNETGTDQVTVNVSILGNHIGDSYQTTANSLTSWYADNGGFYQSFRANRSNISAIAINLARDGTGDVSGWRTLEIQSSCGGIVLCNTSIKNHNNETNISTSNGWVNTTIVCNELTPLDTYFIYFKCSGCAGNSNNDLQVHGAVNTPNSYPLGQFLDTGCGGSNHDVAFKIYYDNDTTFRANEKLAFTLDDNIINGDGNERTLELYYNNNGASDLNYTLDTSNPYYDTDSNYTVGSEESAAAGAGLTWVWNITKNSTSNTHMSINVSVKADAAIIACNVDIDGTNYTMSKDNSTGFDYTWTVLADGNYTLRAYCNDTSNITTMTTIAWYKYDTTSPVVSWASWTGHNITTTVKDTTIRTTADETVNCTLHFNGTDYSNATSALSHSWRITNANQGNHSSINVTCDDLANNKGYSTSAWWNVSYQECEILNTSGQYYLRRGNISNHGSSCFNISADNVTLDCAGYTIDGTSPGSGTASGINITGATNVTIANCTVTEFRYGVYARGMFNSTVKNNTVYDHTHSGFYWDSDDYNSLHNNTVNGTTYAMYLTSSIGNKLDNSSFSTVSGNAMYVTGSSADNQFKNSTFYSNTEDVFYYGSGAYSNTIKNCSFNGGDGTTDYMIDIYGDSLTVDNIIVETTSACGLNLDGSENVVVANSTITSKRWGLRIRAATFQNTIKNNTISATTTSSQSMVVIGDHNSIYNNTILSSNDGVLISFDTGNHNNFTNNTVFVDDIAIKVAGGARDNIFKNNSITSDTLDFGIWVTDGAHDNNFTNNTITKAAKGIYLNIVNSGYPDLKDNWFINNTIVGTTMWGVDTRDSTGVCGPNYFLNTTYDKEYVSSGCELVRMWYVTVNVTNGSTQLNANYTFYNNSQELAYNGTTGADGLATEKVIEYKNISGTTYWHTNYTVNITKNGFDTANTSQNITTNRRLNFTLTDIECSVIVAISWNIYGAVTTLFYPASNTSQNVSALGQIDLNNSDQVTSTMVVYSNHTTNSSGGASNATDGDLTTAWYSASDYPLRAYWQVDLGENMTNISTMKWYFIKGDNASRYFNISYSLDNLTWTNPSWGWFLYGTNGSWNSISPTDDITARYIRLLFVNEYTNVSNTTAGETDVVSSFLGGLAEFEVYLDGKGIFNITSDEDANITVRINETHSNITFKISKDFNVSHSKVMTTSYQEILNITTPNTYYQLWAWANLSGDIADYSYLWDFYCIPV